MNSEKIIKSAICSLFEGDYHYGVCSLANSLYKAGFCGTLYADYRGGMPFRCEDPGQGRHRVAVGFDIEFIKLSNDWHHINYKPRFMRELWGGLWLGGGARCDRPADAQHCSLSRLVGYLYKLCGFKNGRGSVDHELLECANASFLKRRVVSFPKNEA